MTYTKAEINDALARARVDFEKRSKNEIISMHEEIARKATFLTDAFKAMEKDLKSNPNPKRNAFIFASSIHEENDTTYFRYSIKRGEDTFPCEIEIQSDGYWYHNDFYSDQQKKRVG